MLRPRKPLQPFGVVSVLLIRGFWAFDTPWWLYGLALAPCALGFLVLSEPLGGSECEAEQMVEANAPPDWQRT